jgi:CNT family concentrative nucleoside transporter
MAAPASLVISKIVYPETEVSETKGNVKLEVKSSYSNVIDAISHGAADGMKISLNVVAMLIGFIGLITLIDYLLQRISPELSLNNIFGWVFYPFAYTMGVPAGEVKTVATLMGKKICVNEFVAYSELVKITSTLSPKALIISSFALCGFANFSSVGMQIGGIGELAPERRVDLAQLGLKALICGTLASYMSATIAGIILG